MLNVDFNKLAEESDNLKNLPEPNGKPVVLLRSKTNKIFLGLCGGIGEFIKIDAFIVRLIFVLLILLGGWGILVYLIASFMVPVKVDAETDDAEESNKILKENNKVLIGSLLILIGLFTTFNIYGIIQYFSFAGIPPRLFWSLALIFSGIFLYIKYSSFRFRDKTGQNMLSRSVTNKRIAGICGGLAAYMQVDSNLIRMISLLFAFITLGTGAVVYLIMWILVPGEIIEEN